MTDHAPSVARRAMKAAWATPNDWERSRETIKRLYLDQNKSLKEVMTIMNRDYALHATVKMYKSRISQWGLDKKNKAFDMEFVLRKKMHRDAIHKNTSFTVRGRYFDLQAFSIYVKRHRLLERIEKEAHVVDTPEHISYETPATSPRPQAKTMDRSTANNDGRLELIKTLSINEVQHLYRWLLLEPRLTRTIALPESMRTPERLFLLIQTYIAGALRNGIWDVGAQGSLVSTTVTDEIHSDAANQLNGQLIAASHALDQSLFVEARQALERAFALIPSTIRCDMPDIMNAYLIAMRHMTISGFPELADMLRRHFKDVAALVIPPQNPASQIYTVMSELDSEQLHNILDRAIACRSDSLVRNLAPFSFAVVRAKIVSIECLHLTSPTELLDRLSILLFECEQHVGYASYTLSIMSAVNFHLLRQERAVEGEAMSNDMLDRARHCKPFGLMYEIEALEHLAEAQYMSGKLSPACLNLSAAMEMVEQVYGKNHPRRTRRLLNLERWLREGARAQEADVLRLQYDEIMGEPGT